MILGRSNSEVAQIDFFPFPYDYSILEFEVICCLPFDKAMLYL